MISFPASHTVPANTNNFGQQIIDLVESLSSRSIPLSSTEASSIVDQLNNHNLEPSLSLELRKKIMEASSVNLSDVATQEPSESKKNVWQKLENLHEDVRPHVNHLVMIRQLHSQNISSNEGFNQLPWDDLSRGEGRAFFVGGTYGSGKSQSLKRLGINPQDAIAPDPVKLTLSSGVVPFSPKGTSPERTHSTSSEIAFLAHARLNNTKGADYVYDGSLRDSSEILKTLESGKKIITHFSLVPIQQSMVRVLARDPVGEDPRTPFNFVASTFEQTLESLQVLSGLSRDEYKDQLHLQVFTPKHSDGNPMSGVVDSEGKNIPVAPSLIKGYIDSYLVQSEAFYTDEQSLPRVKDLLDEKFFTPGELEQLVSRPWIQDYLELPIDEALNKHASLPSEPYREEA